MSMSQTLEIVLSDRCFSNLVSQCQVSSQSPSQIIEAVLSQSFQASQTSESNAIELEQLEHRLIQLIYQTIDLRLAELAPIQKVLEANMVPEIKSIPAIAHNHIQAKIHQLQIGDLVQIRDPDSDYFNQVMPIIKVGMIRVMVQTPSGDASFLKRDLRFQRQ
jgi:hypothetical protein